MTFDAWAVHFELIYGVNNVTYFTSLSEKIGCLFVQTKALQDAIRKQAPRERQERVLAHVFAWTFAVVNHCRFESIATIMCEKYPAQGCGYCLDFPCSCDPNQSREHQPQVFDATQAVWDLNFWQRYFELLYGPGNRQRGIENALNRMFAEVGEVTQILTGAITGLCAREIKHQYGLELADVFAWIFAIAVLQGIDLSSAVSIAYRAGCPSCRNIPCECPKFVIRNGTIVHAPHVLVT